MLEEPYTTPSYPALTLALFANPDLTSNFDKKMLGAVLWTTWCMWDVRAKLQKPDIDLTLAVPWGTHPGIVCFPLFMGGVSRFIPYWSCISILGFFVVSLEEHTTQKIVFSWFMHGVNRFMLCCTCILIFRIFLASLEGHTAIEVVLEKIRMLLPF